VIDSIRTPYRWIVGWFFASRLAVWLVGLASTFVVPDGPFRYRPGLMNLFVRWDSNWYLIIVNDGYSFSATERSSVAFFPAYPTAVKMLHVLGLDARLAGYLVTNLAALGSCILLHKLARRLHDETTARLAVVLYLLGPMTVFHNAVYSESLFLLAALGAVYGAFRRNWIVLGLCGVLVGLSRTVGVLLVPALLVEVLELQWQRPYLRLRGRVGPALVCFAPLVGLGIYALYLQQSFGDPFALSTTSTHWGRALAFPWQSVLFTVTTNSRFYVVWFVGFLLLGWLVWLVGIRQGQRLSLLVLAATTMMLYVSSGMLEAIPRYLSVVFPLYLVVAHGLAGRPALRPWTLGASAAAAVLSIALFVNGYWFT